MSYRLENMTMHISSMIMQSIINFAEEEKNTTNPVDAQVKSKTIK